ncbi:hypothetical protein A2U01_0108187, partial [Trifolium medium]|nr:hypothetical protein [Trifolium medium]
VPMISLVVTDFTVGL